MLDLHKLLNHSHPHLDISNATFLVKPNQLLKLERLLSTYTPRDIANLLGWRSLVQLVPHMNANIRLIGVEYDKKRHFIEQATPR